VTIKVLGAKEKCLKCWIGRLGEMSYKR